MKKLIIPALLFIAIGLLTQWLVIKYIPNIVHAIALQREPLRNQ